MKSVSQHPLKTSKLSDTKKYSYSKKIYGTKNYILSIIMEYADDGDLYQKITEHKTNKNLF